MTYVTCAFRIAMAKILLEIPAKVLINDFLFRCREVKPDADLAKIKVIAEHTIRHLSGSKLARETTRIQQELETRWYASLDRGRPDFSIISKRWHDRMRLRGYRKIKTKLWNSRPAFWVRP